jgi:hypothetical protein
VKYEAGLLARRRIELLRGECNNPTWILEFNIERGAVIVDADNGANGPCLWALIGKIDI